MAMFKRERLVERLSRDSRWRLFERVGDIYALRSSGPESVQTVQVSHSQDNPYIAFQCFFPVGFPLERPPHGLFGRLLLRSYDLKFASWQLDIAQNCEAKPFLFYQCLADGMTPGVFDKVCREMAGEVRSFHQELRDKFRYDADFSRVGSTGSGNQPVPASGRDIVWLRD